MMMMMMMMYVETLMENYKLITKKDGENSQTKVSFLAPKINYSN